MIIGGVKGVSVRPPVPFFSFSVLKSFNGVSREFKWCLKFKGCFKEVLTLSMARRGHFGPPFSDIVSHI